MTVYMFYMQFFDMFDFLNTLFQPVLKQQARWDYTVATPSLADFTRFFE